MIPVVAATRSVTRDGGAVVKVLQPVLGEGPWRASLDPGDPYYWRNEADFYTSGVAAAFGDGLAVPECHGVADLPDGAVAVRMADVTAAYVPSPWPVETYERVAAGTAALARVRWGVTGWLRAYVARHDAPAPTLDEVRAVTRADAESLVALWHERETLLRLLDSLPRALCHHDFSVQNVFPGSDPPTVIDWAFAGDGAVGTDVGPLAVESVLDFHLPPGDVEEVAARTHDAYVAAVDAPADDVRLGLAAGTAVKFSWVLPCVLDAVRTRPPLLNRRPLDEALPIWSAALAHLAAQAATCRRLRPRRTSSP